MTSDDDWEPQSRVGRFLYYGWGFSIMGMVALVAVAVVFKVVSSLLGFALHLAETFTAAIVLGVVVYLVTTHGRRVGK